ncbi:hypothetical protein [Burkholderia ubonensis]|uniref:hypothetical protein n=1 Tax=Burkholderia ubonensis TaxID=101571 RepID=UPI000B1467CA|nr:hypothetical protein [Burkholderia ubonensis]
MTKRKHALKHRSNPASVDDAHRNLGHARYVLDNFGVQLHVNDVARAGLARAGQLYFPSLLELRIVGFQVRPERWLDEVKPQLDRLRIPHVWRRLASGYDEVREHGAAWPTP